MEFVLIPGFWLDGASWAPITDTLEKAGHSVHPLTLPGKESRASNRVGIGLRDHIDAVVNVIDSIPAKVVLVGHSGGGAIAYGASDARPDRVSRVIYVDSGPLADGGIINDEFPAGNGEIPLPDWDAFDEPDLVDLTDELRERFREMAVPEPVGVATERQRLSDARRFDIPSTIVCCEFSREQLQRWIDAGDPNVAEVAQLTDVELVDLPTGHWPQLTRPDDLADAILTAASARASS